MKVATATAWRSNSNRRQLNNNDRPTKRRNRSTRCPSMAIFLGAVTFGYTLMTELYFGLELLENKNNEYKSISLTLSRLLQIQTEPDGSTRERPNNKGWLWEEHDSQRLSGQPLPQSLSSNSICQALENSSTTSPSSSSPLQWWLQHRTQMIAASQLAMDREYQLEPLVSLVWDWISPRLPHSIKALPRQRPSIQRIMEKLHQRWEFLQRPMLDAVQPPPPPVIITVLGGSVTAGVHCHTGIYRLHLERCAWPARLQQLLDHWLGPNLVRIQTVAAGGTNTATGTTILEYDLVPDAGDIYINAYATNDMHILTLEQAQASNHSLRDQILDTAQAFVRTVLQKKLPDNNYNDYCEEYENKGSRATHAPPPLLLWLDDYLGNEQREILATQALAQSLDTLANYYGFGLISYADLVREWVYGDTRETLFSPAGWYDGNHQQMKREVHPGQGMHQAVADMVLYYLGNLVSQHCALQVTTTTQSAQPPPILTQQRKLSRGVREAFPRVPTNLPDGLPPPLLPNLTLDVVSDQWHKAASIGNKRNSMSTSCNTTSLSKQSDNDQKHCPFSWVSAIPWREKGEIEALFRPFVTQQPQQWHVHDTTRRQDKLGWMPLDSSSEEQQPQLQFVFPDNELASVTLFYMKSYGAEWADSVARVTVERSPDMHDKNETAWTSALVPDDVANDAHTAATPCRRLSGFHDKKTSETYTETLHLQRQPPPATVTTSAVLRVTLTLERGSTFKLMGIAVCRS